MTALQGLLAHVDARAWATLAVLAAALLLRRLTIRALGRSRLPIEVRARWLGQLRVALLLGVAIGLAAIWGPALRDIALSLAAVAVAFVVATREILACLTGAFLRTASRSCSIGDRIEVQGVRGDVIELGALTTTLLEVGHEATRQTGRSVSVPNSRFLDSTVWNESHSGEFGLQQLRVPLPVTPAWQEAERRLLEAARLECAGYLEPARRRYEDQAWKRGLGPDSVEPTVTLSLPDRETIELLLRFPAPAASRARLEQAILRRYLGQDPPQGNAMITADPQAPAE